MIKDFHVWLCSWIFSWQPINNQYSMHIQIRILILKNFSKHTFITRPVNQQSIFNAYMIKDFTFDFVRGFFHDNQSTFNIQCIYDFRCMFHNGQTRNHWCEPNDSVYRAPAPLPRHRADRPASNTNPSSRRSQAVLEPLQAVLERGSTPLSPPPGGLEARQGGRRVLSNVYQQSGINTS